MKRDLIIVSIVLFVAALGVSGVFWWQMFLPEVEVKPVLPKTEPVALLPKKEEPKKIEPPIEMKPKKPVRVEKKREPEKKIAVKPPAEEPKRDVESKVEPKVEVKAEPKKKIEPPPTRLIVLDNLTKINDPQGEFVQPTINGGKTIVLLGVVKTLKIAGLNEGSTLDATRLEAEEILFTGHLNAGSKALLGKSQRLTVRDVNDRSTLDASELGAKIIHIEGGVNGNSNLKLHAPGGVVEFRGELNDRAQIDVNAPAGKVTFKGRGDSAINGGTKISVIAKQLEMIGTVNGPLTTLDVTLTKNGALAFRRINGGVTVQYAKAASGDPDLHIDRGVLDARAVFRQIAK